MPDVKEMGRIERILKKIPRNGGASGDAEPKEDTDIAYGKKIGQAVKDAGASAIQQETEEYRRQVREAGEAREHEKRRNEPQRQGIKTQDYIMPQEKRIRPQVTTLKILDLILFVSIVVVHVMDWRSDFGRTSQSTASFFAAYIVLALLSAAILKFDEEGFWPAFFKRYFWAAILATAWPRIVGWFFSIWPQGLGFTIIGNFGPLDFIFIIATLLPVYAFMTYRNSNSYFVRFIKFWYGFWIALTIIFIVAGQIEHIPGGTGITFQSSDGLDRYWEWIGANFEKFMRNLVGFPAVVQRSFNMTRYTDSYFTSEVEQSKNKIQVGVQLDDITFYSNKVRENDKEIRAWTDVKAESFTGNIVMHNTCKAIWKSEDPNEKGKEYYVMGTVDPAVLNIHDYERAQLDCSINRQAITAKNPAINSEIKIQFISTFNFVTWGYMDIAFMEREQLWISRETINDELNLPKNVVATSSRGPVKVGIADATDPPLQPTGLSLDGNPPPPIFGVTLESNEAYASQGQKQGQLLSIKRLVFHLPKYMTLKDGSCPADVTPSGPVATEDGIYNLYTFLDVPVHKDQKQETIQCRLDITPSDIPLFLGESGIAFATFAVEAEYDYVLTITGKVTMAKPEKPQPEEAQSGATA